MNKISWEVIRSGQVAAYKDSIYEYKIETDLHENIVKEFCTSFLKRSKNESAGGGFNGSCSFPFGMESYYKFKKISDSEYSYIVCAPYTG